MGLTTLGGSGPRTRSCSRSPGEPAKLQAPRGTQDVLPEHAADRLALETAARRILEGAGYARIETPAFEATELFARGVGASTDIVQKEMYTFQDAGGRSLTLRPEGTAPICRAYVEHGMHKAPQPVKLWYLSSFFRYERAQAGRYRQFWQVGAEAIGSSDPAVDAELIALLHALLTDLGVRDVRLRVASLGRPEARAAYRELLVAHLRAHEDELSEEVRARIDLNPLRAFDAEHPGTAEVMASAPLLVDHLDPRTPSTSPRSARGWTPRASTTRSTRRSSRAGLLHAARVRVHVGALGAQSAVGGGGRYDGLIEQLGGPPTPGIGWAAGAERILLAAEPRPRPRAVCDLYVAGTGVARSRSPPRRGAPASACSSSWPAARARAG
jgi:histidyl-tRNA synthetase